MHAHRIFSIHRKIRNFSEHYICERHQRERKKEIERQRHRTRGTTHQISMRNNAKTHTHTTKSAVLICILGKLIELCSQSCEFNRN